MNDYKVFIKYFFLRKNFRKIILVKRHRTQSKFFIYMYYIRLTLPLSRRGKEYSNGSSCESTRSIKMNPVSHTTDKTDHYAENSDDED